MSDTKQQIKAELDHINKLLPNEGFELKNNKLTSKAGTKNWDYVDGKLLDLLIAIRLRYHWFL